MNLFNQTSHHLNNNYRTYSILIIILSIVTTIIFTNILSDFRDEFYQALCAREYKNAPLASLTFYIGHIWCQLLGESLLSLRILVFVMIEIAIAIASYYFYSLHRNLFLFSIIFFISSISANLGSPIYDWNSIQYPFVISTLIFSLHYYKTPTVKNTILMGTCASLMTLSRIPNAIVLPILLCIIIIKRRNFMAILKDSTICLLSFIVSCTIIILIMYGNIYDYIIAWNHNNIISGHQKISNYIWGIKECLPLVLIMSAPIIITIFFSHITSRLNNPICRLFISAIAVCCTIILFVILYNRFHNFYGYFIMTYLFLLFYGIKHIKNSTDSIYCVLIATAFSLIPAIGSDMFILRPLVIPIIPILISELYPYIRKNEFIKHAFLIYILSTIIIFGIMKFQRINDTTILSECAFPQLKGMRVSTTNAEKINRIKPIVSDNNNIAYVGSAKYVYDYLFSNNSGYRLHLFHYHSLNYDEINNDICCNLNHYAVIRIVILDRDMDGVRNQYPSLYEENLLKNGFDKTIKDNITYFKKQ